MTDDHDRSADRLDRFLPHPDRVVRHETELPVPAAEALAAMLTFDAYDSPLARVLIGARGLPDRLRRRRGGERSTGDRPGFRIDDLPRHGWLILADRPDVERVYGTITRPWSMRDPGPAAVPSPEAFALFDEPGFAKIATSFRAEPRGPGCCALIVETRVRVTDPVNRRRFLRYWRVVEPFSRLIRLEALRLLRRRLGATAPSPGIEAPLPEVVAAFGRCAGATGRLWRRSELRHVPDHVGWTLRFGDGSTARVYRETVSTAPRGGEPCLLVVEFRLRLLGRYGPAHAAFRAESWCNTPLFAGFPGFRSKLWLTDPDTGAYRGVYEWDGPDQAAAYADTLSRLLNAVSVDGSVRYHVEADVTPRQALADPAILDGAGSDERWWRITSAEPPAG